MLTGPLQRLKLGTEFLAVVLTMRPQLDNTLPLLQVKGVPGLSHQRWPWNHQKTVYPSAQPLGWRKEVSRGCWLCALEAAAHGLGAQRGSKSPAALVLPLKGSRVHHSKGRLLGVLIMFSTVLCHGYCAPVFGAQTFRKKIYFVLIFLTQLFYLFIFRYLFFVL